MPAPIHDTAAVDLDAFDRSQSAVRAEEFAANAPEPEAQTDPTPLAPGVVSAGYSDTDLLRAEHAPLELILGKPWAITRQAAVEVATRLAMQTQAGHTHVDSRLLAAEAAARGPIARRQASDGSEIAVIPLRGTITPRGSLFSLLFGGGGGLQGFREQFRGAVADGNVSAIVIDIDSPGGLIDLVPEASAEIFAARGSKPITAIANTTCASAAYWIASAADKIIATPSAQVGSIGVFTIHEDFSRMEDMMGIKTTLISAGQFKTDGNPYEPLSKTARASLQNEVDDLYSMFTAQVAQGRGVKVQAVTAGYGRGRCLLADQALLQGMVDGVATLEQVVATLGGAAQDPAAQPGDLMDDCDEDEDGMCLASAEAEAPTQTSPDEGDGRRDVSTPSADYLSDRSAGPAWSLR